MKLLYIVSLLLSFCASWAYSANNTTQNLGIAFVHGTSDHREDAATEYWKPDFVATLANTLPNPDNVFIVHCNFSYYMWEEEAGGCLANQLLKFIDDKQITKLIVYTHSNGGNVMRWILSNPTFDSRYLRVSQIIHQVIAIAPSSGGTVLADDSVNGSTFAEGLSWILGYRNGAVKQQRISDMAIFNDELLFGTPGRPSLMVPFRTVVGTDVISSPFNSLSYCNGYLLNVVLELTQSYLDKCSDGFLNCSSQSLAGTLWFYDWQKTNDKTPLSHSQSRHSCFGFEEILRNDLLAQGANL